MYALRERRVHVTQEDFELAVAKVIDQYFFILVSSKYMLLCFSGHAKRLREKCVIEKTLEIKYLDKTIRCNR